MNINYFGEFLEITRHDSLNEAAEAMHMDASTLSRHLSDMEKHYGARLIERNRRAGMTLTEKGEEIYERAGEIWASYQAAEPKALG